MVVANNLIEVVVYLFHVLCTAAITLIKSLLNWLSAGIRVVGARESALSATATAVGRSGSGTSVGVNSYYYSSFPTSKSTSQNNSGLYSRVYQRQYNHIDEDAEMGKTKGGFYAVAIGRKSGIYNTWDECKAQVTGFANARYKKFATTDEAKRFIAANSSIEKAEPVTNQPEKIGIYAALRPNDPVWMKAHGTHHEPKEPELSTFERQYSSNFKLAKFTKTTRGELMGNGGGLFTGSTVLARPKLTEAPGPGPSSSGNDAGDAKHFSTSAADFRRQLRVTGDRVTNNKRKLSDDGGAMPQANKNVKNPETFQRDDDGYIIVFTDGACKDNGKRGAEAGIGVWFGDDHELNISEPVLGRQTNNTAEIQAAERAILQAKSAGIDKLVIQTDSQFMINCVTKWLPKWKRNGWKAAGGKDVKNREDLVKLTAAMNEMEIKWSYVPGHKGHYGNEQADRLAVSGSKKQTLSK